MRKAKIQRIKNVKFWSNVGNNKRKKKGKTRKDKIREVTQKMLQNKQINCQKSRQDTKLKSWTCCRQGTEETCLEDKSNHKKDSRPCIILTLCGLEKIHNKILAVCPILVFKNHRGYVVFYHSPCRANTSNQTSLPAIIWHSCPWWKYVNFWLLLVMN